MISKQRKINFNVMSKDLYFTKICNILEEENLGDSEFCLRFSQHLNEIFSNNAITLPKLFQSFHFHFPERIDKTRNLMETFFNSYENIKVLSLTKGIDKEEIKIIFNFVKRSKTLHTFKLIFFVFRNDDITLLNSALIENKSINSLDLSSNVLIHVEIEHLFDFLIGNSNLSNFEMKSCDLKQNDLNNLIKSLQLNYSLRSLNLSDTRNKSNWSLFLFEIVSLNRIEKLNISRIKNLEENINSSNGITINNKLNSLDLNNIFAIKNFLLVLELQNLLSLNLSNTNIKNIDLKLLTNFISKLNYLENLNLSHNRFDSECNYLIKLGFNTIIETIISNQFLEVLNFESNLLNFNNISDSLTKLLKNCKKIKYLNLNNCKLGSWSLPLDINNTIVELILDDNNLNDCDSINIFNGLINNKTLRRLSLNKNNFSDEIFPILKDCFNKNKSIKFLSLNCLKISLGIEIKNHFLRNNVKIHI